MFCSAGKRVELLLKQTWAGLELELFVQPKICCNLGKAPLLATLEDWRELWSLWGQLHDLTVILCQNKTCLYTSSPPPPHLGQCSSSHWKETQTWGPERRHTLTKFLIWVNRRPGHCSALCLAQLRHSWEDYKATGWSWSTHGSTHVIYSSPLPRLIGEEKLLSFPNSSEFLWNPSPLGIVWPFTQLMQEPRAEMQLNIGLDCETSANRL